MKAALLVLAIAVPALAAPADVPVAARDPMHPLALPQAARGASASAAPELPTARHLLVVDGRRYVVDHGRRRGVGELLGGARIERIEDSAVIVRAGGVSTRLPLFAGVVRRPALEPETPAASAPAAPVHGQSPSSRGAKE